jgi:hypothetical protein
VVEGWCEVAGMVGVFFFPCFDESWDRNKSGAYFFHCAADEVTRTKTDTLTTQTLSSSRTTIYYTS